MLTPEDQPHLDLDDLRAIAIRLPLFVEQKHIVSESERCVSIIDKLETVVTANLAYVTQLRHAILQQAFST